MLAGQASGAPRPAGAGVRQARDGELHALSRQVRVVQGAGPRRQGAPAPRRREGALPRLDSRIRSPCPEYGRAQENGNEYPEVDECLREMGE